MGFSQEENERSRKKEAEQRQYELAEQRRKALELARKEKAIGRKLNASEMDYYRDQGKYPASHQQELRNLDFDYLDYRALNDGSRYRPYSNEWARRVHEARSRPPLMNAIMRLFTPVNKQVPEKYLK